MKEYEIISKYFSPLSSSFNGALNLSDDMAIFSKDGTTDYVITTDAMVEGSHFLENSIPETIAARLLASNLSDIASAGGVPKFYLLNGSISSKTDEKWLKAFADKLSRIQKEFKVHLIGGDTVKSEDKLFFSATVVGEVRKNCALLRSGAKVGDDIYVSGSIGEAYIGLKILEGEMSEFSYEDKNYFINRYIDPKPRIQLGNAIAPFANSCTDISDGFIIDLENICKASGVSAKLDKYLIPVAYKDKIFDEQISAGDDYELIFTVAEDKSSKISKIYKEIDLPITKVGKIVANNGEAKTITIVEANGKEYEYSKKGYQHEI